MTQIQHRLDEVRRLLEKQNLPALLITQTENRRYLSGFTGSAALLLITPTRAILSTDFRYWEQAASQAPPGLALVALLSAEWGSFLTFTGKAMYFALAFQAGWLHT